MIVKETIDYDKINIGDTLIYISRDKNIYFKVLGKQLQKYGIAMVSLLSLADNKKIGGDVHLSMFHKHVPNIITDWRNKIK